MCLAPKMPAPPEPPAPAPAPVITSTQPQTVKTSVSKREALRRSSAGPSSLSIPLSTGSMPGSSTNLSIGK
jgi:hypothetical protein